jgi:hypothetical protein
MDRIVTRRLLAAAGFALAAILLSTCSNPINLLETLETEVKIANNKFLVVKDFTPDNSAANINPGASVSVQFDRALDMTTVTESTLLVAPMTAIDRLDFSFNSGTNTLSIDAYPLYADATDYTVTVTKGVRGADGSEVLKDLPWSYTTGTFPNGNVKIKVGSVVDAAYVTDNSNITMVITTNNVAKSYRTGTSEANLLANLTWNPTPSTSYELANFTLNSGEGVQEAWVQFSNLAGDVTSIARFDTVIRDTIPPNPPTWNLVWTTPSPSLDNTPTWYWTPSEAGAAMYGRWDGTTYSESTLAYYTGGGKFGFADDTDHYLQVRQRDAAGWWSGYNNPLYIYVTPCFPLNGATGESTRGYLKWRSQKYDLGYTLYIKPQKAIYYDRIRLELPEYKLELYSATLYQWYVVVENKDTGNYVLPAAGDTNPFTFTTK